MAGQCSTVSVNSPPRATRMSSGAELSANYDCQPQRVLQFRVTHFIYVSSPTKLFGRSASPSYECTAIFGQTHCPSSLSRNTSRKFLLASCRRTAFCCHPRCLFMLSHKSLSQRTSRTGLRGCTIICLPRVFRAPSARLPRRTAGASDPDSIADMLA